jgi:predicted RNA-binding Zn-ribbon protein involved in translation (DUF1610 family)
LEESKEQSPFEKKVVRGVRKGALSKRLYLGIETIRQSILALKSQWKFRSLLALRQSRSRETRVFELEEAVVFAAFIVKKNRQSIFQKGKKTGVRMTIEPIRESFSNAQRVKGFTDSRDLGRDSKLEEHIAGQKKRVMFVSCRICRKSFETTFSTDDFERLSVNQSETGTLHLCPNCGDLSLYKMKDYFEML